MQPGLVFLIQSGVGFLIYPGVRFSILPVVVFLIQTGRAREIWREREREG